MPKNVKNWYLPSSNYYLRLDILKKYSYLTKSDQNIFLIFKTWGWRIYWTRIAACPRNAMLIQSPLLPDVQTLMLACLPVLADTELRWCLGAHKLPGASPPPESVAYLLAWWMVPLSPLESVHCCFKRVQPGLVESRVFGKCSNNRGLLAKSSDADSPLLGNVRMIARYNAC